MHALPEVVLYGLLVAVLSVIQSIFGIGLLLLGTPILLLTGKQFGQALWVLLPASVALSLLQLGVDKGVRVAALKRFTLFAIPTLALGLVVALSLGVKIKIDLLVGLILIGGAILRLSPNVRQIALRWLAVHENGALAGIGLVHGLTNMGGGLLSLYASIRHVDKYEIRQHIALGYATFASVQLAILAITTFAATSLGNGMVYASISATTFVLVGRGASARVPNARYTIFFSVFEIACGSVLLAKWLQSTFAHP